MPNYEEIVLSEGETWERTLGSGDTVEGYLIDVSAPGADFHIGAEGSGWEIRNIGLRGKLDVSADEGGSSFNTAVDMTGDGLVENVYFGDGVVNGIGRGAFGTHYTHSGEITMRNVHVAEWSGNACYFAGTGRVQGDAPGGGGIHHIEESYFRDCNIAHLRMSAGGSTITNSVFENTDESNIPSQPGDSTIARGIYTGYGSEDQVIEIDGCEFDTLPWDAMASDDHYAYGDLTTLRATNTNIAGGDSALSGVYVDWVSGGTNPDTTPPSGVPRSPKEAAQGGQISCSADGDCPAGQKCEGGTCVPIDPGDLPHGLKVQGNGTTTHYRICFTGDVVEDPNAGPFEQHDAIDGQCVDGWVTNTGNVDGVAFDGTIESAEWIEGEADLFINGQQMSLQEALEWDPDAGCSANADCPDGQVCQNGECVTPEPEQSGLGATGIFALGLVGAYAYNRYQQR